MARYYEKPVAKAEELPTREELLGGAADLSDPRRAQITVFKLLPSGVPDESKAVSVIDVLHISGLNMPQAERFQPVATMVDDGQGFFYGRSQRVYSVSAFIVDSNLDAKQGTGVDRRLNGKLLSTWKNMYERYLRMSVAVPRRYIARLSWRFSDFFGYVTSYAVALDATQPFLCQLQLSFFSVYEREAARIPIMDDAGIWAGGTSSRSKFPALITWDAFVRQFTPVLKTITEPSPVAAGMLNRLSVAPDTPVLVPGGI